jgi:HEAT repeat protein
VPARVWMIRQLEAIGRAEAVEALAGQLKDKDALVSETARRALQNNPAPEAGKILQKALEDAKESPWRVAILNALAYRKDMDDPKLLLKDAASDDEKVRTAAVCALAATGNKAGLEAIAAAMKKGGDVDKRAATDAYLLMADKLAQQGDKETALKIAKEMLSALAPAAAAAAAQSVCIARSGCQNYVILTMKPYSKDGK